MTHLRLNFTQDSHQSAPTSPSSSHRSTGRENDPPSLAIISRRYGVAHLTWIRSILPQRASTIITYRYREILKLSSTAGCLATWRLPAPKQLSKAGINMTNTLTRVSRSNHSKWELPPLMFWNKVAVSLVLRVIQTKARRIKLSVTMTFSLVKERLNNSKSKILNTIIRLALKKKHWD